MPELPEVEVCRRQLAGWTRGRPLDAVHVVDPAVVRGTLSSRPSDAIADGTDRLGALVGQIPSEPVRYGKRLGWAFGERGLLCHLGMTGHWVRRDPSDPPPPQARLGLGFGSNVLWLVDSRRFACVVPAASAAIGEGLRQGCGPDALEQPLDGPGLAARVRCRKPVKVALMEQERLAGIGNIHASEACFRAKISPKRSADRLSDAEWAALASALVEALRFAVDAEASVGDDGIFYVNLGGPNPFLVYSRTGKPCPVCGTRIVAEELNKRNTYWCPQCQPDPS